jgi:LuxR family maltose regulon positive regulatory protein
MAVEPDTTDPDLLLKATPPRAAKWLVPRAQLALSQSELGDAPIVCVEAPAGFGKTALLTQWRREWLARGAVVAWLSVDEDDEPVRFSEAVSTAMNLASGRRVFAGIGRRGAVTAGETGRLTEWLAEVVELGVECVLLMDEVERLPASTAQQSLQYLLRNLPTNAHFVLASRVPIELPLSDLVAHAQLRRVTVDALRFSLEESLTVLQARFGNRLDADECAPLHDRTEGWPLGLQLAIATLQSRSDPREMLPLVSARTGDMRRYFAESLARSPAHLTDFLTRIAVVDHVHPQLCAALTARSDAPQLLDEVRLTTPILTDGLDSEWSTIHRLAREFLLERFEQLPPEERTRLHAAAAAWLAPRAFYEEAARHELEAGRPEAAWELAEQGLLELFFNGDAARVLEWLERLPPAELDKRPRLLLAAGWARAMSVRHAEAAPLARRALESQRLDAGERRLALLLLGAAAFFADDFDQAESISARWRGDFVDDNRTALEDGTNQLAMLALYRGNPAEARRLIQRPAPDGGPGFPYARGIHAFVEGLSFLWEGQPVLAEQVLSEAHLRATSLTGRRGALASILAGPLALAHWEQDQTEAAATLLVDHLDVVEQVGLADAMIASHVVTARLSALRHEERRAYSVLGALHAIGEARRMPRVCVAALLEMIRIHASRGHVQTATTLLRRLESFAKAHPAVGRGVLGGLLQLQIAMATSYAAAAQRDWQRLEQALARAAALAEPLQRGHESLEIRLLQAQLLRATGGAGADAVMTEALSLADSYGLRRIVADTVPELAEWAQQLAPQTAAPHEDAVAEVSSLEPVRDAAASPRVLPSALLTPKERAVLELLARRLANKQIAAALDVGEATVKWHLKNLFAKLGARTREHALQRARMLGILHGL